MGTEATMWMHLLREIFKVKRDAQKSTTRQIVCPHQQRKISPRGVCNCIFDTWSVIMSKIYLILNLFTKLCCASDWQVFAECLLRVCCHFSHVRLFATLRTIASQDLLPMGFSRQEHWSGLPFPPPGDLPKPEIKAMSLVSPALAAGFFTTSATWEALRVSHVPM